MKKEKHLFELKGKSQVKKAGAKRKVETFLQPAYKVIHDWVTDTLERYSPTWDSIYKTEEIC